MINLVLIACGGALGALARYGVTVVAADYFGRGLPWGTLLVNVIGSAVAGGLAAWLMGRHPESAAPVASFAMFGFLGAFTTFSAFSVGTVQLLQAGAAGLAFANVALNLFGCLVACAGGFWLGRML